MQTTLRLTSILDKTILKIHPHPGKPPLQTKDGKMAWFFLAFLDLGGEGRRERVDICFSILFCPRLLLYSATSPVVSGFLIKPDIRTFLNETRRRYSCASKDHNCYHLRGPCLQVKISDKEVSCSCSNRWVIALRKVDAAGEIDSKENSATSANRPRTEWRLTKLHYWLDIGSQTNEWSAFIHFTAAGDDLDRVWVKERWISECRKARLASRDRNTPIRLL